jgi:hypothetical protein
MAKVGTAYVEIKPDISGFARELREKLAKVNVKLKVEIDPDLTGFTKELREDLKARHAPKFKVQADPDLTGFTTKLRAMLKAENLPVVRLRVEPADPGRVERAVTTSLSQATKRAAKKSGIEGASVWAGGFSQTFASVMRSSQIGQALVGALGGTGASGPIGIAVTLAAASVAAQFVSALTGSLLGLLGGLSLVGLGIFGQRNDKEIKARAKKLAGSFTKELTDATKSFKLPILSSLDVVFAGLNESLKILKPTLDAIAPVLPDLAAGFSGFMTEIAKAFADPATRDGFIKFLQVFSEELPKIGQAIGDLFRTIGQHADILAAVLRVFLGIVAGVFDVINGLVALSADNFELLAMVFGMAKTSILVALGALKAGWSASWKAIKDSAAAAFGAIPGAIAWVWGRLKEAASTTISQLLGLISGLPGRIRVAAGNFGSILWDIGRQIIQGLINGIQSLAGGVGDTIKGIINSIPDAAKSLLHINSPSLVMAEIGKGVPEGLVMGMASGQQDVTSQASTMAGWAIPAMGTASFAGLAGMGSPAGQQIQVFIGERELTDIVRVEVDGVNEDVARALIGGRRS